jgi:hypothetical protein
VRKRILSLCVLGLAAVFGRAAAAEAPAKVKFIRFVKDGAIISIAEIEVFSGGKNIAKSGKATQSTTGWEGVPERAVDGNTNGDYFIGNSVSHTTKTTRSPGGSWSSRNPRRSKRSSSGTGPIAAASGWTTSR